MSMETIIGDRIKQSIALKQTLLSDPVLLEKMGTLVDLVSTAFQNDNKVYFCGNGGSAADAQHLAAEFSGRFYFDRHPLYSEALHVNTSYVTAVANDYGYEQIYARLVKAKARENDILIGLTTSGESKNIILAFEQARSQKAITIGFTGQGGGSLKAVSDYLIDIPSKDTPRIQECHMLLGHILCELVEAKLFKK